MTTSLYLATPTGLVIGERNADGWHEIKRTLAQHHLTSVIAREGVILAGTTNGVFRSDNRGHSWQAASTGLTQRHIRWLAYHPDISDCEFAGTEPASIFVSHDGAQTWRECAEIAALRERFGWFLPYSSGAGCVRGFAFHGQRAYAAVEVGGALVSHDGGETWALAPGSDGRPDLDGPPEPFIYPDVHSIHTHPISPEVVFAPTGGGFYCSTDGGQTWQCRYDGYCRAVWVDPTDRDHILLSPADGVDSNGRIEMTRDGGQTWALASTGLNVPWRRGMVERFVPIGDELLAVLSNGQLLAAPLATLAWQRILPDIKGVEAVAVAYG